MCRPGAVRTIYFSIGLLLLFLCLYEIDVIENTFTATGFGQRFMNASLDYRTTARSFHSVFEDVKKSIKPVVHKSTRSTHPPTSTPTSAPFTIDREAVIKVSDLDIYILSAVAVPYNIIHDANKNIRLQYGRYASGYSSRQNTFSAIVLNGWENRAINTTDYTCCFQLTNGSIVSAATSRKRNWMYLGKAALQAKQYVCPLNFEQSLVQYVSLASSKTLCIFDRNSYVRPVFSLNEPNDGLAVCPKLAYGSLDPGRLIEWLEAQIYFGASKVLLATFEVNANATKVLKHYEQLGFVETVDFGLPEKDMYKREIGSKNMQSWNDEQVVLFHCQERLSHFRYVAVVDMDEFLVTDDRSMGRDAWLTFLEQRLNASKTAAGLHFRSKIHITDWGPTTNKSRLFIGRYLNSTAAFSDRAKNVYMTSRVVPGSVTTHGLSSLPGYRLQFLNGPECLHHFRSCRNEWRRDKTDISKVDKPSDIRWYQSNDLLRDFRRYTSATMESLARAIEDDVVRVKAAIGLSEEL